VRRSDRRAVERRSWNQNPNEFRHRVADTLARRRLGVLAASCCTPRTAGAAARLSLIAAPIGLGDAPLAARVSLWAGLLGAIVSRTLAHRHHRRPQSHTIPVPCIGMVRQGRRARGGTRYRAGRVHHPTGSPEQRVPPGPSSSICSRGTSTRRLTLPQPRSSGRSCGQRSSGRTRARACCPPRRAESVIQRAVRRRQGRLMPLSGDRTERDLWVMSQPVAVSPNAIRLKRARHDQFARPSHRAASHPISAVTPRFVHTSIHNIATDIGQIRSLEHQRRIRIRSE
jgi:hypothetical protein